MVENNQTQEVMKADRLQELSELMHKSISKVNKIRDKQEIEAKQYVKEESSIIIEKQAYLEAEDIRIKEDKKSYAGEKREVDGLLQKIEDKVYEDTKQQHHEKYRLDEMIEDLDKEIEELNRVLERKKKEKEMNILEQQVYEQ